MYIYTAIINCTLDWKRKDTLARSPCRNSVRFPGVWSTWVLLDGIGLLVWLGSFSSPLGSLCKCDLLTYFLKSEVELCCCPGECWACLGGTLTCVHRSCLPYPATHPRAGQILTVRSRNVFICASLENRSLSWEMICCCCSKGHLWN